MSGHDARTIEAVLDALHHHLPYPTEACAIVRAHVGYGTAPPIAATPAVDVVERVARAIDPKAWQFIDARQHDDPPHPAVPITRDHVMKQARAAIAALAPAPDATDALRVEWQPIDTAPKSSSVDTPHGKHVTGVYLLGYCPEEGADPEGCIEIIWWEPNANGGRGEWTNGHWPVHPTLWQYQPTPPTDIHAVAGASLLASGGKGFADAVHRAALAPGPRND